MVSSNVSELPHQDDAGQPVVPNIIGGKPVLLPSSASFPVINAASGKVVHYGQSATVEIANQAVEEAYRTWKTYKKTPIHVRRKMLLEAAGVFERRAEDARVRGALETSCTEEWARFNAMQTATFCSEIAGAIHSVCVGEIQPSYFNCNNLIFKESIGPALVIPPWNAALVLSTRAVANALAAGCTVVLKASEMCPWTHKLVMEAFHEAGFPAGAVNLIMADRPAGAAITEAVISHPWLRIIEFIGSTNVGRAICGLAAKYLKPTIMELGDQSPAIIMEDADLPKAASVCARAITSHHGQVCFSLERIIVHSAIQDEFMSHLTEAMKAYPTAGVAVSQSGAEKAKQSVDDAISRGAQFLYGSSDMVGPASLAPSILGNVPKDSIISNGEAFGPSVFVVSVNSEEEAIEEANSRFGGLSSAVWTASYERGIRMARDLEFGMVQVNGSTLFAEPSGPVQGYKGSGWGSTNGRFGIANYLYNKAVSLPPTTSEVNGH